MNPANKSSRLEYHDHVRYSVPASVVVFAALAFCLFCVPDSHAQVNGASASATSQGFGGRAINGTPRVTSLGPNGFALSSRVPFSGSRPNSGVPGNDGRHHNHNHDDQFVGPAWYPVMVPYAVDLGQTGYGQADNAQTDDNAQADDDADYQGGPTVFDRRGLGADSYVPPVQDVPTPHAMANSQADPADEPPQLPTTLIFKDGHEMQVGNYAIVGETLFDLTPGHARRVALSDLNLDATRKQNEDHGVVFELPSSPQAN
jgi:hypothetical protein